MSLTSKEAKAASGAKEEKDSGADSKVRWAPKTPVKEAAQLSSIAGNFLEHFGEDISQEMADDRTAMGGVSAVRVMREAYAASSQARSQASDAAVDARGEAVDVKSKKRPHSPTPSAVAASADEHEDAEAVLHELKLPPPAQQDMQPKPEAKKFHSYTGATFGIQPTRQSATEVPLYTAPLNPWYLSLGMPNFSKTHRPPQSESTQKRQRIESSEMEKKFEDSWWKPYLEKADRIVAASAPVAEQLGTEDQQDTQAAANEVAAGDAQLGEDASLLAALRQEKDADKKLQDKILDAIFNAP